MMLVVQPANGLCNRLGVLTSFAVLARRAGRQLRMHWTTGPGWSEEDLSDVFENPVDRLCTDDLVRLAPQALRLHEQVAVTGVGALDRTWGLANARALAAVFDVRTHPVVIYAGGARCQDLLAPEDRRRLLPRFETDYVQELRRWRPVPEIRNRVADVAAAFDRRTVGVHIRRGDALHHPRLAAEYRCSPDDAFISAIERILRFRPSTTFYLATDAEATERLFIDRYGSRIIVNPFKRFVPSVTGAPKENQRDAVIDLFALARTRLILGSHYSSFSTTAALLGGARLWIARDGSLQTRAQRKVVFATHEARRRWSRALAG